MGLVSLWVPFLNEGIFVRWFSMPNLAYLSPIPLLTAVGFVSLYMSLVKRREIAPFFTHYLSFCTRIFRTGN